MPDGEVDLLLFTHQFEQVRIHLAVEIAQLALTAARDVDIGVDFELLTLIASDDHDDAVFLNFVLRCELGIDHAIVGLDVDLAGRCGEAPEVRRDLVLDFVDLGEEQQHFEMLVGAGDDVGG